MQNIKIKIINIIQTFTVNQTTASETLQTCYQHHITF
jgi:hypothetical protein